MVSTHGESIRSVTAADMHANFSCLAHPLISWTGPRTPPTINLTEEQLEDIQLAFNVFDPKRSGT